MQQLIPQFVIEKLEKDQHAGQFQAFSLFIDLTDFTPLTVRMMEKGKRGAEQLSEVLNGIFAPLVQLVYQHGGFIPYFAGDAFTALFPSGSASPEDFIRVAQLIRDLVRGLPPVEEYRVGVRLGLSAGAVHWGIVGGKAKAFYFRGEAVDNCAEAQKFAGEQEIVIDQHLRALLPQEWPLNELGDARFFRLKRPLPVSEAFIGKALPKPPPLDRSATRCFLPDELIDYPPQGEFRNAVSIFLSFHGMEEPNELNTFAETVLKEFFAFSGYFKEIDFGDKGGVMVGFFGAPIAFENNLERALEFAVLLRSELWELRERFRFDFRMGITSGIAFTGIIGGEERCQYAVVGNRVNLAARLMIHADWGEVLVDESMTRTQKFKFLHKGDIRYKGFEKPVPTHLLVGKRAGAQDRDFSGAFVGREQELLTAIELAGQVLEEQSGVLLRIFGEGGIGKSRFVYEWKQRLPEKDRFFWKGMQADQILQKPFHPFIECLRSCFHQDPDNSVQVNSRHFDNAIDEVGKFLEEQTHPEAASIGRELERTRPVLAALMGLPTEGSLWEQLDAAGRYENTLSAISNYFLALSIVKPLALEIEDGHSLDENSMELLEQLGRRAADKPLLIVLVSRFLDDGSRPDLLDRESIGQGIRMVEIDLQPLGKKEVSALAAKILEGPVSTTLEQLLFRVSSGVPFYTEQILQYFVENNLLTRERGRWHINDDEIKVSGSIQSILLARIDRLSHLVKETVKTAAVIGREFELPVLSEVMTRKMKTVAEAPVSPEAIHEQVRSAEKVQIWRAVNELRYMFRHSLLRETLYEMQLSTRLKELHQLIAEAIEKLYADRREEHYLDLAYHFRLAAESAKTIHYLGKAADHAIANYQNRQAVKLLSQKVDLLRSPDQHAEKVRTLLQLSRVFESTGRWDEADRSLRRALRLADKQQDFWLIGRVKNELGRIAMLRGDYTRAKPFFEEASVHFDQVNDLEGRMAVFGNLGTLFFRQGQYNQARTYLIQNIEQTRKNDPSGPDAQIISTLGLAYMNLGNYAAGIRWLESELQECRERGDKRGMASLYTNMGIVYFEKGDLQEALRCFEEGLQLSEELGNKLLVSIAKGSMGSVFQELGQFEKAMRVFEEDILITEELGDKQGISIANGLIGELMAVKGEFDQAEFHLKKSLQLARELGYQKGIAKAVNNLGDIAYLQEQFEKAHEHYQEAIQVTRQIRNKLVLGQSLVEQGVTLLALGQVEEAGQLLKESQVLAAELGNPDLLFQARLFSAKYAIGCGRIAEATDILETLLREDLSPAQQASVRFNLYKLFPDQDLHRREALRLYRELYERSPQFLYQKRIGLLDNQ